MAIRVKADGMTAVVRLFDHREVIWVMAHDEERRLAAVSIEDVENRLRVLRRPVVNRQIDDLSAVVGIVPIRSIRVDGEIAIPPSKVALRSALLPLRRALLPRRGTSLPLRLSFGLGWFGRRGKRRKPHDADKNQNDDSRQQRHHSIVRHFLLCVSLNARLA